jgi:hypothetical protein
MTIVTVVFVDSMLTNRPSAGKEASIQAGRSNRREHEEFDKALTDSAFRSSVLLGTRLKKVMGCNGRQVSWLGVLGIIREPLPTTWCLAASRVCFKNPVARVLIVSFHSHRCPCSSEVVPKCRGARP